MRSPSLTSSFRQVEFSNSNYVCYSYGKVVVSSPVYKIVYRLSGAVKAAGKRKHIVEVWNTQCATPFSYKA